MALIDKETIRTEIERRNLANYCGTAEQYEEELFAILDSIQEQPVVKKSNALFDECVENCDPAVMKEVSDNVDKMLGRQPVTDCRDFEQGLEEEINREIDKLDITPGYDRLAAFARHFAEWGAAHLK